MARTQDDEGEGDFNERRERLKALMALDSEQEKRVRKLMDTGRRYEGMEVEITGKHPSKGKWGVVTGDHDSPARAKRLAQLDSKASMKRKGRDQKVILPPWDPAGILVSVRLDSGQSANNVLESVPVECLVHRQCVFSLLSSPADSKLLKDARSAFERLLSAGVQGWGTTASATTTPSPPFSGCQGPSSTSAHSNAASTVRPRVDRSCSSPDRSTGRQVVQREHL